MDATQFLRPLAIAIRDARLDATLIGSAGAAILGARVTTEDFDFMFKPTPGNLRKLKAIADDLDATIVRPFYPVSSVYTMQNERGLRVDFMPRVVGITKYESLRARSQVLVTGDWSVRVASLKDIIKSKRAAGRPKDIAAMPELEALQDEIEAQEE